MQLVLCCTFPCIYTLSYCLTECSVDATKENSGTGRFINHHLKGNVLTKVVSIDDIPHLYFVAIRNISPGEELCYDYGDRRKDVIKEHPWLLSK